MKIEVCVVRADMASYSAHAWMAAERQAPGKPWICFYDKKPPKGHVVTHTHQISLASGIPSWAYSYWRPAE